MASQVCMTRKTNCMYGGEGRAKRVGSRSRDVAGQERERMVDPI